MDQMRPDPSVLLELANKTEKNRGRLKIFLGAAPGVGKTYSMLSAAKKLQDDNHEVVVGLVETHGRKETEELLHNLTILPRVDISYKGKIFSELNLALILQQKPEYVLVDELAHSNIPGSKHTKRYLDVLELLDAGINVYTTLNIQHIESLNDDIKQVTGITVREIVPDAILDNSDQTVVIDLAPEELIQRLREGRVYLPDMAQRAIQHFFSMNNIAALRELTFRMAAKHAGQDLANYKHVHGIEEPWHVNKSILVCLGPSAITPRLIRLASRFAKRDDAKLIALHIESPGKSYDANRDTAKLNRYKLYAQQQGAEIVTLNALNKANAIIAYAKAHNVTQIVMGKSPRSIWLDRFFGSIVHEVIRHSQGINVHVIGENSNKIKEEVDSQNHVEKVKFMPFFYSFLGVILASWLAHFFHSDLSLASNTMLFLLVIIFSAFRFGLYPSLFAAISSFLVYLFFYLPPYYAFHLASLSQGLTFIVFIVVSITISQLAGRARESIHNANRREHMTSALYTFSQNLAVINEKQALIDTVIKALASHLGVPIVFILPEKQKLKFGYPKEIQLHKKDWAAAKWSWEHKKPCGKGTETLAGVDWYYYPLHAGEDYVGVIAVKINSVENFFRPETQYLFLSMTSQAAVAMAKINLEMEREEAKVSAERERLRQVLLSSVSQDFQTPLANIIDSLK